MSALAFTPGPWWLRNDGDVTVLGHKTHTSADGETIRYDGEIARVQPQHEPGCRKANARLIAAAPELYEAGVHALRELDCLAACIYHDDQRQEVQAFADRFRAVLAKARGETL